MSSTLIPAHLGSSHRETAAEADEAIEVLPPRLQILSVTAPSEDEVGQAEDDDRDPTFLLHLDRPLTHDERRVVQRDLPHATLPPGSEAVLGLAISPYRLAADGPKILDRLVHAISLSAPTLAGQVAELTGLTSASVAAVLALLDREQDAAITQQ